MDTVFDDTQAGPDPIALFNRWFDESTKILPNSVNVMTLATVSPEGQPTARIVLLKDFSKDGFTFYTNYESIKAHHLSFNSRASLLFYWEPLQRQIRIEGQTTKVSPETSAAYFTSRPRESQLGAHASSYQSAVLTSRKELEEKYHSFEKQFAGQDVPCPDYWGGYLLSPNSMEFWQGQPHRLHDRIVFIKSEKNWDRKRLFP